MAKIFVDIPNELIAQLDSIAKLQHVSRASLICTAISNWLNQQNVPFTAFGLLKDKSLGNSVQWQKQIWDE
ncbi:MAG: ribbon-helix-helix domain-containing protein [Gammaproteobacteria bacterium]|nr:ribbon-helix-helix domain-containing protein [Gammaproteobacteria bacterium]